MTGVQTCALPIYAANRIVAVNPAFERVTGYRSVEAVGRDPHFLSSGRHTPFFYQEMWQSLLRDGHWRGDMWNRRKSGEIYLQRLTLSLIRDSEGRVINHVGVFSDITDEKQEAEQIMRRASYAALTNLPNRALLYDRLQQHETLKKTPILAVVLKKTKEELAPLASRKFAGFFLGAFEPKSFHSKVMEVMAAHSTVTTMRCAGPPSATSTRKRGGWASSPKVASTSPTACG